MALSRNTLHTVLGLTSFLALCGFKGCPFGSMGNNNFDEKAIEVLSPRPGLAGVPYPLKGVIMEGQLATTNQFTTEGSRENFDDATGFDGVAHMYDIKLAGNWYLGARFTASLDSLILGATSTPCRPAPGSGINVDPGDPDHFLTATSVPLSRRDQVPNGDNSVTWICYQSTSARGLSSSPFVMSGSTPSQISFTSQSTAFRTDAGVPLLYVYGSDAAGNMSIKSVQSAFNVSPDSATATFPFPTRSDGSPLDPGAYSVGLVNQNSDGSEHRVSGSFLNIGRSMAYSQPYSVASEANRTEYFEEHRQDPYNDGTCAGQEWNYSSTSTYAYPIVTQYSSGNIAIGEPGSASTVGVGQHPTAVALYNIQSSFSYMPSDACNYSTSQTYYHNNALVVNSGSDSVSIVDLPTQSSQAVGVGSTPIGVKISADESKAYVINAGDNSVSIVDLGIRTETRRLSLGGKPSAVTIDDSGNVWIAGAGYLARFDGALNNPSYLAINGSIISLRYSSSELIATRAADNGDLLFDEIAPDSSLSSGSVQLNAERQIAQLPMIASGGRRGFAYATANEATPIVGGSIVENGPQDQGSWMAVSGTPDGFVLSDIISHSTLMASSLGGAVTGISIDDEGKTAYLTVPDQNKVVAVDMP